jgi:hypothetical protein
MCLLADNIRNEVVTIHNAIQNAVSLHIHIPHIGRCSDLLFEAVRQEYFQVLYKYFLSVFFHLGAIPL